MPIWVLLIFIILHIYCLNISLLWKFCNWGSKHSLVFYKVSGLSIGIRASTFVLVSLPKCDPSPLVFIAMDGALYASLDVCECNMPFVCEKCL